MSKRRGSLQLTTPVRYIKLGRNGRWESECLEKGMIRYGFDTASAERFPLCRAGQWTKLTKSFLARGKDKGTATRHTNETRLFFEDNGAILWITFMGERLYWGFLEGTPAERHSDDQGVWRAVKDGWCCTDLKGGQLTTDRLSGSLTQLASYRGTSCSVRESEYAIRRINGDKTPQVEQALDIMGQMKSSVVEMLKLLGPRDFETLVDLVFSTSGWRRQGPVGGTQKTRDLDLTLPSTGERAFVQVKSKTTTTELTSYTSKLTELGQYDRMFFVYHSGNVQSEDPRITVIGPDQFAGLLIDAGLVNWLISKVS